jgi:hypothetical protein
LRAHLPQRRMTVSHGVEREMIEGGAITLF